MNIREELKKELARRDYAEYTEYVHMGNWIPSKHLLYICKDIDLIIEDKLYNEKNENVQILIIELPPQHR